MRALTVAVLTMMMAGCTAANAGMGVLAAVVTAEALVAAGASRAGGGCYASCSPGTYCNGRTGLCVALPCHGRCADNEACMNEGWFDEHCEPARHVLLQADRKGESSHQWP